MEEESYGQARRKFWEHAFAEVLPIALSSHHENPAQFCARIANEALLEWEKRWVREASRDAETHSEVAPSGPTYTY